MNDMETFHLTPFQAYSQSLETELPSGPSGPDLLTELMETLNEALQAEEARLKQALTESEKREYHSRIKAIRSDIKRFSSNS